LKRGDQGCFRKKKGKIMERAETKWARLFAAAIKKHPKCVLFCRKKRRKRRRQGKTKGQGVSVSRIVDEGRGKRKEWWRTMLMTAVKEKCRTEDGTLQPMGRGPLEVEKKRRDCFVAPRDGALRQAGKSTLLLGSRKCRSLRVGEGEGGEGKGGGSIILKRCAEGTQP